MSDIKLPNIFNSFSIPIKIPQQIKKIRLPSLPSIEGLNIKNITAKPTLAFTVISTPSILKKFNKINLPKGVISELPKKLGIISSINKVAIQIKVPKLPKIPTL